MFKKRFNFILFLFSFSSIFAQKDGYWDKERSTSKEIVVSARNRVVVKVEDLPVGTTEVIYRITLLDKNQQMASSLISVLKAIPDPTGISQGSAGAVFLMSKISGEDKCKYAVFSNVAATNEYVTSGNTQNACWVQNEAVSKDAKRLTIDQSDCLKSTIATKSLWFGIESKNWVMSQKLVIEVVPWVDYKLSRGWSKENRKLIMDQCKTSNLAQKMPNSSDFCVCVSEKIQSQYKYLEFQKLWAEERSKAFRDNGSICYKETNVANDLVDGLRNQVNQLSLNNQFGAAIEKSISILNTGQASALDYNNLGSLYLLTKQYAKALKTLKEAEKIDETELLVQLNLAHAYLLNGDFKTAKSIHKNYLNQNVTDSLSWKQKTKLDIENFQNKGIQSDDFQRVLDVFE